MELTINTINDCADSVDINCSPTEWLIIRKALKLLVRDEDIHPNDRAKAMSIIDIEPNIDKQD